MDGNNHSNFSNHVAFVKIPNQKYLELSDSDVNFNPNKMPTKFMHRAISNPAIYESEMNSDFTNSDTDEDYKDSRSKFQNIKVASSDPNYCIKKQWDKMQFSDTDEQYSNMSNSIYKRFSSASIPINVKNKLSLQKYRQLSCYFNKGRFSNNQLQKANFYEKKICVGLGFPSKKPIFTDNSDLIKKSDKKYDNLENIIQQLKNEDKSLSVIFSSNDSQNEAKDNEENCPITKNDISHINNDINSTKKYFIEMESDIISDLTDIKSSISKILEERKEIQKQHRIWLSNMKKKIYQTKEKTKNIECNDFVSIYVK